MEKISMSFLLAVLFLMPISVFAAIETVTHTVQQPFGGSQSPDDARTAGIARAKREALERFGTYIESTTVVKNSQVDSDVILALTAGVTKAEVIKQKNYTDGDGFGLEITVKVELDTTVLEKSLKKLLADRNRLRELNESRKREEKLLVKIVELQKRDTKKGKTKQQSAKLKKEFHQASQELEAIEWWLKAIPLLDGEKYRDPNKAIEYITQSIKLKPNFYLAFISRGLAYVELKEYDRAMSDYDHAIQMEMDPDYRSVAYNNRGSLYGILNKSVKALSDFDQALRLDQKNALAYRNRGTLNYQLKNFDKALSDFGQALLLEPNDVHTYENRGVLYTDLKKFDYAMADYNQAILIDPETLNAYLNRGILYADLKQFDRAILDFNHAIRIDPNDANIYLARGNTYTEMEQYDRAIADLDQAIRIDPNDVKVLGNRGLLYNKLKQFDRAIVDFNQAIRIDPKGSGNYVGRGNAYAGLKQYDLAIADLDQAIRIDPNDAVSFSNRGIYYIMIPNADKACMDLNKACSLGDCKAYTMARNSKFCR